MPEQSAMDNRTLLRRTLLMVGVMVGGCTLVVGTLTLVASAVVSHVVDSPDDAPGASSAAGGPQHPGAIKPKTGDTNPNKKK